MTIREIIYIVLDEIKLSSDDSYLTEEHVLFLANKMRAMLLKQRYSDIKKQIPESNYQTICLDLESTDSEDCNDDSYLRSTQEIPTTMKIGNPRVYPFDYYNGNITYISRDRMRYVGYNKYMRNIIYASLGPDNHLYLKSNNPQFMYLEKVKFTGIFEDIDKANELQCENEECNMCPDSWDNKFPIEDSLVPELIKLVLQELLGVAYRPTDTMNNSADDLSDIIAWARKNMKSGLQKQIEG